MLPHLHRCLVELRMGDCHIGADGARALAESLGHLTALKQLWLDRNDLGADGARALAQPLGHLAAMTSLRLEDNDIGADGARARSRSPSAASPHWSRSM